VDRVRQDANWQTLRERARSKERLLSYVEQHRRVIAAISQREAHAAERAMREHLEQVRASLLGVMTQPLTDTSTMTFNDNKNELRHGT